MEGGFNITNQGAATVVVSGMDGVGGGFFTGTLTAAAAQLGTIQGTTTVGTGTITTGSIGTATIGTGSITALTAGNATLTTTAVVTENAGVNTAGGISVLGGGTIGAGGVAILGTAATGTQLSDLTRDYHVYVGVTAGGTSATLTIGPANTCVNTLYAAATCNIGTQYSFRLPAGWYVRFQATAGITQQIAISC